MELKPYDCVGAFAFDAILTRIYLIFDAILILFPKKSPRQIADAGKDKTLCCFTALQMFRDGDLHGK